MAAGTGRVQNLPTSGYPLKLDSEHALRASQNDVKVIASQNDVKVIVRPLCHFSSESQGFPSPILALAAMRAY